MNYQANRSYLKVMAARYVQVIEKQKKSYLLTEGVHVSGLSRKHLIRKFSKPQEGEFPKKKAGRPKFYSEEILLPHVKFLWEQMGRMASKRMKAALPEWLSFLSEEICPPHIKSLIIKMSESTLERFLKKLRVPPKGLSTTKSPASYMKNIVPLNTFGMTINKPGFTQSDTVAHCGTSAAGPFISSLTLTDIDSTWTENRALFTKKGHEVRKNFIDIKLNLPFELLAVNVDSGSEFLNTPVIEFMNNPEGRRITFTRSRPYQKNDNAWVEQKNYTHVRELFGYERLEEPMLVDLMNDIYTKIWNPLQNFFLPTFKLKEKTRIGSKIVKKYDKPLTPYERLMRSPFLKDEQKQALKIRKCNLNPFELKKELELKLEEFFKLVRDSKQKKVA